MTTNEHNVSLIEVNGKGRGIQANRTIDTGEVILSCPVKVLGSLEYYMLRLMPAIASYVRQSRSATEEDPMAALFRGLETLVQDPEAVLSCDQTASSAEGAIMYTFSWTRFEESDVQTAAIAFGLASLCNHAETEATANARVVRHLADEKISIVAIKTISQGSEILIRYQSVPFLAPPL